MATKNAAFRNGQADYFGTQFDGGSIDLLDASSNVLATITLNADAFAAASSGAISANGLPLDFTGTAASGTGTDIASGTLKSSDGTQEITGLSVGNVGSHIILDNTNIAENQNGKVNTLTITIPADIANAS